MAELSIVNRFSWIRLGYALLAASVCWLLGGCSTPSLNGIATPENAVVLEGLVGPWTQDREVYIISGPDEGKLYSLVAVSDPEKASPRVQFRLVRIGESLFADLEPSKTSLDSIGQQGAMLLIPVHNFMRVSLDGDTLRVTLMEDDYLKTHAKDGTLGLAHAWKDDDLVLTAKPEELRDGLQKLAAVPDAWQEPKVLRRLVVPGGAKP
jgi:hypothetical protein